MFRSPSILVLQRTNTSVVLSNKGLSVKMSSNNESKGVTVMGGIHDATSDPQPIQTSNNALNLDTNLETPSKRGWPTMLALRLSAISSIGGFIFGYESGQISGKLSSGFTIKSSILTNKLTGFMLMSDFRSRFGENNAFSAVRQGTIVGLLSIGTLIGCLSSAWICDKIGRRYTISASSFFYIVGVVIEVTSNEEWVQFVMGRLIAGLGIGALSTSVPMYQSESVPKDIRGIVVSSYQLLITLGIWTACMVSNDADINII